MAPPTVSWRTRAKVSKFIFLSTAHVYASPLIGKFSEETFPNNKHPYATSNIAGENAVLNLFTKNSRLQRVILRLSNGVGSPMDKNSKCWGLFINDLCKQIVENGSMTVRSDYNDERDFFPISLLEDCILTILLERKIEHLVINVSSSKSI